MREVDECQSPQRLEVGRRISLGGVTRIDVIIREVEHDAVTVERLPQGTLHRLPLSGDADSSLNGWEKLIVAVLRHRSSAVNLDGGAA